MRNSPLAPKQGLSSDNISFNKAPRKSPIRIAKMMKTKTQNFFLKKNKIKNKNSRENENNLVEII